MTNTMSSTVRRSNSTNPRPGSSAFPLPLRISNPPPSQRPAATTGQAHISLRPPTQRPTPQQAAPERTYPQRDSLRPAPLRTRGTQQRPTPQQAAPQRTFQSKPQSERPARGPTLFSSSRGPTPQQSAPRRTFPQRAESQRAPIPQRSPGVDGATKTQINQTYAITMMASPYNPLPFFLPIPLGVAMLLTPTGNQQKASPTGPTGEQR
ncbi:hypothetical protein QBC42DRAFT_328509 [Cladorrhinum samala]|uniref:Uncharacterized protein n=1 Tax=Cladorrhinum samala TaxID=585594 RepID=A0AAV9HPI8_9PEZI|nr:hypothetical protein QBC42DRAFT_328509 [Cladorrhinum samala]